MVEPDYRWCAGTCLAMEKGDPDIMDYPPRPKDEKIVNRVMKYGIFTQMLAQSGAVLSAFMVGLYWTISATIDPNANPVMAVCNLTGSMPAY